MSWKPLFGCLAKLPIMKLLCRSQESALCRIRKRSMQSFQRQNLWKLDSQFDNIDLLNSLTPTVLFQPLIDFTQIQLQPVQQAHNFMKAFTGGAKCVNSLRLLSTQPSLASQPPPSDTLYFCTHARNERTHAKRYSLLPYHGLEQMGERRVLGLDEPSLCLVIEGRLLAAVEKQCVTLYHIQDGQLMLKDFDAVGAGTRLLPDELSHVKYQGRDYLLLVGNEKEGVKPFLKCLVYLLEDDKLKFIKKASLFPEQRHRGTILYDHYPGHPEEKFCMVVGGFSDYEQQHYVFGALQIHLHLLLAEWLDYPLALTREVPFQQNHTLTAGCALKVSSDIVSDECWLLFCTEYQTLSRMVLQWEQEQLSSIGLKTCTLAIRDDKQTVPQPLLFTANTLYLARTPFDNDTIPYRLYWCDRSLTRVRSRPLRQLLALFTP